MDLTSCAKCGIADDVSESRTQFIDQYYVDELLHVAKSKATYSLHHCMSAVLKNESDFHITHKEVKYCRKCKVPLKLEDKWLLEMPNIYALGL